MTQDNDQNELVETNRSHLWKKGQSGNPAGRPKRKYFTQALLNKLDKEPSLADEFIESLFTVVKDRLAITPAVARLLWDRLEGPITQDLTIRASTQSTVVMIPENGREATPLEDDDLGDENDENDEDLSPATP